MTPTDSIAWKRIVNTPPRKIGPTSIEKITKYVNMSGIDYLSLIEPVNNRNQTTFEDIT